MNRFTSAILALGVLSCTLTTPTVPREATNATVTYWQQYRQTFIHRTVELRAPNVTGQKAQP